ncbi:hypothetical protein D3C87_1358080 [compost metagenome]
MQGVGVDVAGGRVVNCAVDFFPAQDWQARTGFFGAEQLHLRDRRLGAQVLIVQFGGIIGEVHGHFAAWRQQRVLAEAAGRGVEKVTAGLGQGTNLRGAVGGGKQCGGTSGGVVGRMGFTFEYHHAPVLRQPETGGSAGNPAADDDEVCLAHENLLLSVIPVGAGSLASQLLQVSYC